MLVLRGGRGVRARPPEAGSPCAASGPDDHERWPLPQVGTPGVVRMNVVWLSRRTFESMNRGKLTGHQAPRVMGDDEDPVVEALHSHLLQWNKAGCVLQGKGTERAGQEGCRQGRMLFDLVVLEGSDMVFDDQVGSWAGLAGRAPRCWRTAAALRLSAAPAGRWPSCCCPSCRPHSRGRRGARHAGMQRSLVDAGVAGRLTLRAPLHPPAGAHDIESGHHSGGARRRPHAPAVHAAGWVPPRAAAGQRVTRSMPHRAAAVASGDPAPLPQPARARAPAGCRAALEIHRGSNSNRHYENLAYFLAGQVLASLPPCLLPPASLLLGQRHTRGLLPPSRCSFKAAPRQRGARAVPGLPPLSAAPPYPSAPQRAPTCLHRAPAPCSTRRSAGGMQAPPSLRCWTSWTCCWPTSTTTARRPAPGRWAW
jgi:hypothetical protein